RDLVAGPDRDRGGHVRARGDVDEVHATLAQPVHDLHRVVEGEPAIGPVRGREANQYGQVIADLGTDRGDGLEVDAGPVLRGAAVVVGAGCAGTRPNRGADNRARHGSPRGRALHRRPGAAPANAATVPVISPVVSTRGSARPGKATEDGATVCQPPSLSGRLPSWATRRAGQGEALRPAGEPWMPAADPRGCTKSAIW